MSDMSTSGESARREAPFFHLHVEERRGAAMIDNFKEHLRKVDPQMYQILESVSDTSSARQKLRDLLNEREYFYHSSKLRMEDLERVNSLNCIQVLKNFISERNEMMAGTSVLEGLMEPFSSKGTKRYTYAFYVDLLAILKGSLGHSEIYQQKAPDFLKIEKDKAAELRSDFLDEMSLRCWVWMHRYPHGLQSNVILRREENRKRIMDILGGKEDDWNDYRWQRRHTINRSEQLAALIDITEEERTAIDLAISNHIPFGITPYYVSLMDREASRKWDHAVRAQVIPTLDYLHEVLHKSQTSPDDMDYMLEGQTSPVPLVTRRYPMIAILKPYKSCAQVCVYCQRNWEIKDVEDTSPRFVLNEVEEAINWFEEHPMVKEVLITGGDPGLLSSEALSRIMGRFGKMKHVTRIRLGTRLPVVLPMRIHSEFVNALLRGHDPPHREVCVVTHIEHPYEVTPELVQAVQSLRQAGMSVYNQQVFTFENSRRFETTLLRHLVKLAGVDPYYTFNTKGKEETIWFRVPIARILQEVKEEARLLPGLTRTDEPVFNIPGLGKNHLRAWQHHDLISLSPIGERIYEFHPWEKNIALSPTYVHRDVPLIEYLDRLQVRGESPSDYWSIWYYF